MNEIGTAKPFSTISESENRGIKLKYGRKANADQFLDTLLANPFLTEGLNEDNLRDLISKYLEDHNKQKSYFNLRDLEDELRERIVERYNPKDASPETLVRLYRIVLRSIRQK